MVCTAAGSSRRERHSDHGIECDPPSAYRSLCIQEASTYRAAVGALAVSQENDDDTQALFNTHHDYTVHYYISDDTSGYYITLLW